MAAGIESGLSVNPIFLSPKDQIVRRGTPLGTPRTIPQGIPRGIPQGALPEDPLGVRWCNVVWCVGVVWWGVGVVWCGVK